MPTECEEGGECFQFNKVNIWTLNRSAVFTRDFFFFLQENNAKLFSSDTLTLTILIAKWVVVAMFLLGI